MIYLDEEAVRAVLRWDDLIPAMEAALAAFSSGGVLQPVRTMLTIDEDQRYVGIMPAVVGGATGLKMVSFYPCNAGSAIPTHMAVVLLFRTETGEPLAAMGGRLITEMRTAAVSAAVTKRLAAPAARVLALLGSGVQAAAHLEALSRIRHFEDVRVWSPTAENRERFAARHGVRAVDDPASAVRGADVVVAATSSQAPVVMGEWLKPGAHVNAVGACRPHWRELDDRAMRNVLIVDSREAARKESGDVILSGAPIFAEAGEIFAATIDAPAAETTVFKSLGLAVEDVATAQLVYERTRPSVGPGQAG